MSLMCAVQALNRLKIDVTVEICMLSLFKTWTAQMKLIWQSHAKPSELLYEVREQRSEWAMLLLLLLLMIMMMIIAIVWCIFIFKYSRNISYMHTCLTHQKVDSNMLLHHTLLDVIIIIFSAFYTEHHRWTRSYIVIALTLYLPMMKKFL